MGTVLHVNGDGSGTIDQRLTFTTAALAQLKTFAVLDGANGKPFDPVSEDQARAFAARIGPGVAYVSSTPIDDASGQGRATVYSFPDINALRIDAQPPPPAGMHAEVLSADAAGMGVTFALSRANDGNATLRIGVPQPSFRGLSMQPGASASSPEQLAMMRRMLAGARVTIAVEPAGAIVKTSSPYVDGQRVTLLDLDLDLLLKDDVLTRMRAAQTPDALRAIMKDVPGLKLNLDREITIEFTPAK